MLAPLIVFAYNRYDLLQKTLEAANNNSLAAQTDIYIYCDGPKAGASQEAIDNIIKTREVAQTFVSCCKFKRAQVIISEANKGLANSIIGGVTEIIKRYGTVIVLEDDLVTAPNFLQFMNDCLDFYKDDAQIWSIGATTHWTQPLEKYHHDVFLSYRGESCGWATWSDRWESIDWKCKDWIEFSSYKRNRRKFNRGGWDLSHLMDLQMNGEIDSWAIRFCYEQFKQNKMTVLPRYSLVENVGFENGTHCKGIGFLGEDIIFKPDFDYHLEKVRKNFAIIRAIKHRNELPWYKKSYGITKTIKKFMRK